MKRNTQIPSHGLWFEGAAFDDVGHRLRAGTGGGGRARCRCGWLSEWETSGNRRKQAHADHKNSIRTRQVIESDPKVTV